MTVNSSAVTEQWPNKCGYTVNTDGARLRTGPADLARTKSNSAPSIGW
ncbi:hypothetical protein [Streptomyces mesophilus]